MAFIKLCFGLLIFFLAVGALISVFIFAFDVLRWHDREEQVIIKPSHVPDPPEPEVENTESEVIDCAIESDEHNSSTLFGTWG